MKTDIREAAARAPDPVPVEHPAADEVDPTAPADGGVQ